MADNFLERHREDYEKKKALWLKKTRGRIVRKPRHDERRPEDEAL